MLADSEPAWLARALSGEAVSQSKFAAQLRWFSRFYQIVPLSEIVANISDSKPRLAITFDDGFRDNLEHALPVLKSLGLPATLFAVSDHIDSGETFEHHKAARFVVESKISLPGKSPKKRLRHFMAQSEYEQRADERDRFMTSTELSAWVDQGFSVESHGKSHTPVADLTEEETERELTESETKLETITGTESKYFAFPIGKEEHMAHPDLVRSAGYRAAFSSINSAVSADTDPYAIPRICMRYSLPRSRKFLTTLKH